jgi:hypothetical protein
MDKLILSAGLALIALGVGFLAMTLTDYNISSAYTTGGYLWLVIGAAIAGLGFKVKRSKQQQLGAMR